MKFMFKGKEQYIHKTLAQKVDNIKKIVKKDWDAMVLIDGKERSGKSTLGQTMGAYYDPENFGTKNMAKDIEDAKQKIKELPDKSVLIMDEGSLIFNSKDAMTRGQKELTKIMDVVGQKNMFFIVILPSVFDLNKQIAVRRSLFLLHVYTDKKLNRGKFSYYSEKRKKFLYELGKKNHGSYQKPKPDWRGDFSKFNPFGADYKEVKKQTLISALDGQQNDQMTLSTVRFYWLCYILTKELKVYSQSELTRILNENGLDITVQALNKGVLKASTLNLKPTILN